MKEAIVWNSKVREHAHRARNTKRETRATKEPRCGNCATTFLAGEPLRGRSRAKSVYRFLAHGLRADPGSRGCRETWTRAGINGKTKEKNASTDDGVAVSLNAWIPPNGRRYTSEESDGNDRMVRVVRHETRVLKVVVGVPPVTRFRDEERETVQPVNQPASQAATLFVQPPGSARPISFG